MTAVYRTESLNMPLLRSLLSDDQIDQMVNQMERGCESVTVPDDAKLRRSDELLFWLLTFGIVVVGAGLLVYYSTSLVSSGRFAVPFLLNQFTGLAIIIVSGAAGSVIRRRMSRVRSVVLSESSRVQLAHLKPVESDAYAQADPVVRELMLPKLKRINANRAQLGRFRYVMTSREIAAAEDAIEQASNEITADYRARVLAEFPGVFGTERED